MAQASQNQQKLGIAPRIYEHYGRLLRLYDGEDNSMKNDVPTASPAGDVRSLNDNEVDDEFETSSMKRMKAYWKKLLQRRIMLKKADKLLKEILYEAPVENVEEPRTLRRLHVPLRGTNSLAAARVCVCVCVYVCVSALVVNATENVFNNLSKQRLMSFEVFYKSLVIKSGGIFEIFLHLLRHNGTHRKSLWNQTFPMQEAKHESE